MDLNKKLANIAALFFAAEHMLNNIDDSKYRDEVKAMLAELRLKANAMTAFADEKVKFVEEQLPFNT